MKREFAFVYKYIQPPPLSHLSTGARFEFMPEYDPLFTVSVSFNAGGKSHAYDHI